MRLLKKEMWSEGETWASWQSIKRSTVACSTPFVQLSRQRVEGIRSSGSPLIASVCANCGCCQSLHPTWTVNSIWRSNCFPRARPPLVCLQHPLYISFGSIFHRGIFCFSMRRMLIFYRPRLARIDTSSRIISLRARELETA